MVQPSILFLFLAAQALVQVNCSPTSPSTPEEFYNSICPSLNNAKDTIDGVEYIYRCGTSPSVTDPTSYDAENPQDCARICSKNSACTGCIWSRDRSSCWLTTQDSRKMSYDGYLLMTPTGQRKPIDQKPIVDPTPIVTPEEQRRLADKAAQEQQARDLIAAGMYVCPKFDGKDIETTNLDGTVNKWRIYCDHTVPEIDRRTQGWLDVRGPYQELLQSGGLDWRYRALWWHEGDWVFTHQRVNQLNADQQLNRARSFQLNSAPGSYWHAIARIDEYTRFK